MKIYSYIKINAKGKVVKEVSREYHGKVALCKYGNIRAQKSAEAQAEKSYQLQLQQQEEEKKRLADIKAMEDKKVSDAAKLAEEDLQKKRKGNKSTILTDQGNLGDPNINVKSLYA